MPWIKYDSKGKKLQNAISLSPVSAVGVSNVGNTGGNTGLSNSIEAVLAATGGTGPGRITLSQSTVAGSAPNTVWIQGEGVLQRYRHNTAAMYSLSSSLMALGQMSFVHIQLSEPISFTKINVPVSISLNSAGNANTAAIFVSATMGLYKINDYTTVETRIKLNPITGVEVSSTYSWASNSGLYSSLTGPRMLTFNVPAALSAGEYYVGLQMSSTSGGSFGTATTALDGSISILFGTSYSVLPFRGMSESTIVQQTNIHMMQGVYTQLPVEGWNQVIPSPFIVKTGTAGARANNILIFENIDF